MVPPVDAFRTLILLVRAEENAGDGQGVLVCRRGVKAVHRQKRQPSPFEELSPYFEGTGRLVVFARRIKDLPAQGNRCSCPVEQGRELSLLSLRFVALSETEYARSVVAEQPRRVFVFVDVGIVDAAKSVDLEEVPRQRLRIGSYHLVRNELHRHANHIEIGIEINAVRASHGDGEVNGPFPAVPADDADDHDILNAQYVMSGWC